MDEEDSLDKAIRLAEEADKLLWQLHNEFYDDGAFTNSNTCEIASRAMGKSVDELKKMRGELNA